jgi:hypothetical protein
LSTTAGITAGAALSVDVRWVSGVPMPTVFRSMGTRFFFYSNEGAEPPHVHVEHAERTAKFWLRPVECTRNRGFSERELRRLAQQIHSHLALIEEAWHEHFGS